MLCFHLPERSTVEPHFRTRKGDQKPLRPGEPTGGGSAGFVSDRIYTTQSKWYHFVMQKYGLPLDSRHLYTKSDWEFFAAAVASKSVRAEILDSVARWVNETITGSSVIRMTRILDTR